MPRQPETRLHKMGSRKGEPLFYEQRRDPVTGRWQWTHILVAVATYGPIPKGFCVHHINGIKLDNRPENLRVMPLTEHWALHTYGNSSLGEGLEGLRSFRSIEATKLFNSRPEVKAACRERQPLMLASRWNEKAREEQSKRSELWNSIPEVKEAQSQRVVELNSRPEVKEAFKGRMREYNSRPEVKEAAAQRMREYWAKKKERALCV